MNKSELDALIAQGESEQLEFKTSWNGLEDACKTLCGFLNGQGGRILFGVRNDKTVKGVEYDDHMQQVVALHVKKFDPAPNVRIEAIPIAAGKFMVVLTAQSSYTKMLYQYDGRVFERIGSTKQVMPIVKQHILLLERLGHVGYEALTASHKLDDLDLERFKNTIKHGIAVKRIDPDAEEESLEE